MATKKPTTKKRLVNALNGEIMPPVDSNDLRIGLVQAFVNAVDVQDALVASVLLLNSAIANIVQAGIDIGATKKPKEKDELPDPSVSFLNAVWFDLCKRYTVASAYQNTMLIRHCVVNKLRVMPGLVNYNAFRQASMTTGVPSLEDPNKLVKIGDDGKVKEVKPSKNKGKPNAPRSKRTDKPAWDGIILATTQEGFGNVMRLLASEIEFDEFDGDDDKLVERVYAVLADRYDALEVADGKIKVKK